MTNPQEFAAQQVAGMASATMGQPVSEEQIAQQAAESAGIGATEVDPALIEAIVAQVKAQLAAEAAASPTGGHPLVNTVASLAGFLGGHGDQAAIELGADLVEAAGHAIKSGSTEFVQKIQAKLLTRLRRNPPVPGENYAYRQALDFAGPHLDDALEQVTPPTTAVALPSAGGPPVKVLQGSVTG